MKKALMASFFILIYTVLQAQNLLIPEVSFSSYWQNGFQPAVSYLVDTRIDTGLKYGVQFGLGLEAYNISSFQSNFIRLDSIRLSMEPIKDWRFTLFSGKNRVLGRTDFGYNGLYYHHTAGLDYQGFHVIRGTGLEVSIGSAESGFVPHIMLYSPEPFATVHYTNTNALCLDGLILWKAENYRLEGYFGVNYLPQSSAFIPHYGLLFTTVFNRVDFSLSLYKPDNYTNTTTASFIPAIDELYIQFSEHIIAGWFEQTLSVFSRPSIYNQTEETLTGDVDVSLSLGIYFENAPAGLGLETTLGVFSSTNALFSYNAYTGPYAYFIYNTMKYRVNFLMDVNSLSAGTFGWSFQLAADGRL